MIKPLETEDIYGNKITFSSVGVNENGEMVTWDSFYGWQTQQQEIDTINYFRKKNGKEPLPGGTPTEKAPMTLDEAIKHCEEKANEYGCCDDCRMEHKQLADWLKELKALKEKYNV